jgi:hypothetical protein
MDMFVGNPTDAYILVTRITRTLIVLHASPGRHNTLRKKTIHATFTICFKVRDR